LRVAVDALTRDLMMAGAGRIKGGQAASLIHYLAPVLPFRQGASGDDAVRHRRTDTITGSRFRPPRQTTLRPI